MREIFTREPVNEIRRGVWVTHRSIMGGGRLTRRRLWCTIPAVTTHKWSFTEARTKRVFDGPIVIFLKMNEKRHKGSTEQMFGGQTETTQDSFLVTLKCLRSSNTFQQQILFMFMLLTSEIVTTQISFYMFFHLHQVPFQGVPCLPPSVCGQSLQAMNWTSS